MPPDVVRRVILYAPVPAFGAPRIWGFGDAGFWDRSSTSFVFPPRVTAFKPAGVVGPDLKSGSAVVRALRPSTVLVVGDVITPGGRTLGDGDVGHEVVVGGAMPVVLTVRGDVDVAGADLDDLLAP